ncbi:MAG: PotD/PotF family extracellular solute-binding protein [Solirubrobacterales bacterium]
MKNKKRLAGLAAGIAAIATALGLAACGGGGGEVGGANTSTTVAKGGTPSGSVLISNWPGYVAPGPNGTVAQFDQQTGVKTDYKDDINSNTVFFNKLKPQLDQGNSGGRSLFVVTDWMAKRMYDLGYLQQLNHDDLQTVFQNILPQFEKSSVDPDRKFSIPWQGGQTGIWVDTAKAPEITSVAQLFDPKYKGKVTFLDEMRDTVPLVLQSMGINPDDATKDDWMAAIDKLRQARDSGQIRKFTGNEYTEDLTSGNIVAALGWSGDGSLIGNKNAEWRRPTDGCDLFFDQAVIPVGAPNTAAALAFLNFAYTPENAAKITDYVQYVTPVNGVRPILEQTDPKVANDPKIFPTEQEISGCSEDPNPPGDAAEVNEVEAAFQEVVSG